MTLLNKKALKSMLGELPLTAEIDWLLRQKDRPRKDHYSLDRLKKALPEAIAQTESYTRTLSASKNVLIFAPLHYWIVQSVYIGLTLARLGHNVTLLTLPYSEWHKQVDNFTQRQRSLHTRDALQSLDPLVKPASLLDIKPIRDLPESLEADVREISLWDVQYTLMREEVDLEKGDSSIYNLRLSRNSFAARASLAWLQEHRPDVVLIPNGLILEMGIVFRVARYLGIQVVTFEFNDQREQIWLAQNSSIMRQDTDYLVEARCSRPMTESMYERLAELENARRGAKVWGKSKRQWQYVSVQGGEQTRKTLGLDNRPVVMLAANVLGDSLTLGRHVFSQTMSEWIARTVRFFTNRPEIQLVIRIHPGETLVPSKSMSEVVRDILPEFPEHIHLIAAADKVNTYDLIEIADLGLAYTTTVGLETAMNGCPVIVCGQTHYLGRGFTLDPNTWDEYLTMLERVLADLPGHRLNEKQIETAWNYAYRFFFEYAHPFPWRLMGFWEDLHLWPLDRVLSPEGQTEFGDTFRFLVGEPFFWKD